MVSLELFCKLQEQGFGIQVAYDSIRYGFLMLIFSLKLSPSRKATY